jgi:hypothetical protein
MRFRNSWPPAADKQQQQHNVTSAKTHHHCDFGLAQQLRARQSVLFCKPALRIGHSHVPFLLVAHYNQAQRIHADMRHRCVQPAHLVCTSHSTCRQETTPNSTEQVVNCNTKWSWLQSLHYWQLPASAQQALHMQQPACAANYHAPESGMLQLC